MVKKQLRGRKRQKGWIGGSFLGALPSKLKIILLGAWKIFKQEGKVIRFE